jgi:hypothetical protein
MDRNKIILISAFIIAVFAFLFLMENTEKPPKSKIEPLISQYKGQPGFLIVSLPKFLMGEFMPGSNLELEEYKKNIHEVKVLIFHEKESNNVKFDNLNHGLIENLNSFAFEKVQLSSKESDNRRMFIKEHEDNWNESVLIFTSDSSLFLFDIISSLDRQIIHSLADSIRPEKINFN